MQALNPILQRFRPLRTSVPPQICAQLGEEQERLIVRALALVGISAGWQLLERTMAVEAEGPVA